jgi:hypothetical protein
MIRQTVHLVACTKTKTAHAAPAAELYCSPWFKKARAYAAGQPGPWFILSAAHGLLEPQAIIHPYDTSLHAMNTSQRRQWARRVHHQLLARRLVPCLGTRLVFLAGDLYRRDLVHWFTYGGRNPAMVDVPLQGLGLGEQLAWLTKNAPAAPTPDPPPPPSAIAATPTQPVVDERPPLYEENEAYIAYLRAQLPLRARRRWGRDAGSDPSMAGLDTPLFRPLLAS